MKKLIIMILGFVILCFAIPIIFTNKPKAEEVVSNTNEISTYDYKQYNTIKLLHNETGEVQEIALDEYLYGVVASEMPASFEMEALKAQAVVARTYTIYKAINGSKHENANICDLASCCQAWISKEDRFAKWNAEEAESNWNKITEAVDSTKGEIITYNGSPINAFFHSNSGGKTEIVSNVWGGTDLPYLQAVATSGEDAYSQYSSSVTYTKDELIEKIKEYHADISINFEDTESIKILEYTDSGRVKTIKLGNIEISGVEARNIFGLKSANFILEIAENNIFFNVIGYGHGVGMSQTGADSMAKEGKNYKEIITHYYTGVEIENI